MSAMFVRKTQNGSRLVSRTDFLKAASEAGLEAEHAKRLANDAEYVGAVMVAGELLRVRKDGE